MNELSANSGEIGANEKWTRRFLTKFTRWIDPKLEKYREPREQEVEIFLPDTKEDFAWLVKRLDKQILRDDEKDLIFNSLAFQEKKVRDVMVGKSDLVMVRQSEFLGPLILDKLYRSGSSHFLVTNEKAQVVGTLDTRLLNKLQIKETDTAKSYMDRGVFYMREDYNLPRAIRAMARTGRGFFAVVNLAGEIVGTVSIKEVVEGVIGRTDEDEFDDDENPSSVVKRVF